MHLLIIYAHPNHQSLNGAILKEVRANLSPDHEVRLLDLYADKFDPVLHFDADHPRRLLHEDAETARYRDLISWADQLILIFPIWWGGMPAILKGFIDRVFAKDFAYSYKGLSPVGHLGGKKAWIITTHDTPAPIARFFVQDYGRILKRQVLGMCGIKPVTHTAIPYVRGTSETKLAKQLEKIGRLSQSI